MAAVFDIGDVAGIQTVVKNAGGTLINPSEVLLYLAPPSGAVGTYTLSGGQVANPSTGTFSYNGTVTQAGYHNVRWVGTGAADFGDQSRFFARTKNT
jgi:hypothetical protein